jgi:hypothetical protein
MMNWMGILASHASQISPRYWRRVLGIGAFSTLGLPARIYESLKHGAAIRRHQLPQPPVFIIGHWRSGTTNVHNLLLQDPAYAYVSLLHCCMPHGFLTLEKIARRLIDSRLPEKRPMDAVALGIDEPMSEDFGLVGVTDTTHYLSYFFPHKAEQAFRDTVLFENQPESVIKRWTEPYQWLLKKVSYAAGGKRLLLKNPPNIGRVRHVLKMYPDAKFVHVLRNPYRVHASTVKLMQRFVDNFSLQKHDDVDLEHFVSVRYQLIMDQWLADRDAIPAENFIEVRHEDVIENQVETVENIYRQLNLPGFEEMRPRLEAYVESLSGYQNNEYAFSDDYLERIEPYVGKFAKLWGYEYPGSQPQPSNDPLAVTQS